MAEQYQLFPSLSEEEYENLAEDIKARGVLVDVEVDEEGNILDGHHRAKIADSLGIEYPRKVRRFGSEDEKIQHVLNLNLSRRHLNREQREALVAKLRERGWSLRRIGSRLGVSPETARTDLAGVQNWTPPERVDGADGKSYAPTPPPTVTAHTPREEERARELVGAVNGDRPVTVQEAQREARKAVRPTPPRPAPPAGTFDVIYADPPWRYEHAVSTSREIENQYPTMELAEIKTLEVPVAEDAVLFLWATSPKLLEALEVMAAWGFEYRTCMVWVKHQLGMGYYVRQKHELLLIGRRGNPGTPEPSNRPPSVLHADRGAHSEKPEQFYELIETMYPERSYCELFARSEREGWESWGNQV